MYISIVCMSVYKGHFPLYIGDSVKLQVEVIYNSVGAKGFFCIRMSKIEQKSQYRLLILETSRKEALLLSFKRK